MIEEIVADMANVKQLKDERDIIEAKANIRNRLSLSQDQVHVCGKLLKKMAKEKTADKDVRERNVKRGHEWLENAQQRLVNLATESHKAAEELVQARQTQKNGQLQSRRKQRRENRSKGGEGLSNHDFDLDVLPPETEQEAQFAQEVATAYREEDELLQLIIEGLDELHQLAITLNKLLKKSSNMIDNLNTKMDKVQHSFDKTNQKLEVLLEKTGGISRWCPICICVVILLACAGFIVAKVTNQI